MRNYFDFKLKGSQIFIPVLVGILLSYLLTLIVTFALADFRVLINSLGAASPDVYSTMANQMSVYGNPFYVALIYLVLFCLEQMIYFGVLFFIVRASVSSLSYKGESLTVDYDIKRYFGVVLKGSLLSLITLGIYTPWFIRNIVRYFSGGVSYRFDSFEFRGKGITLFAINVLLVVLPATIFGFMLMLLGVGAVYSDNASWVLFVEMILGLCLLFALCMAQLMRLRWLINFNYGLRKRVTCNVNYLHAGWFIFGQVLLSIITFWLYYPMAVLRVYNYFAARVIVGEDVIEHHLGFTLNVWKDYLYLLGQILLSIITLGIYSPWAFAKISTRLISHTYVEEIEDSSEPMPVAFE